MFSNNHDLANWPSFDLKSCILLPESLTSWKLKAVSVITKQNTYKTFITRIKNGNP
jgi:hypothetical protein